MTRITERLFYRIAKRWIAGYTLQDAMDAARNANQRKIHAILNRLGEHTPDQKLIQQYVDEYLELLETIQSENLQANISVKPSQIDLAAELSLYKYHLLKIFATAEVTDGYVFSD